MWTKTGRRTLHLSGLVLWFILAASTFADQPALTDRAFALLLAAAITSTAGGLFTSITALAQAMFEIGVLCGRTDERRQQLDRGCDGS